MTPWPAVLRLLGVAISLLAVHFLSQPGTVTFNLQVGTAVSSGMSYGSQGGPYSSLDNVWPAAAWAPFASNSPYNRQLPDYTLTTLDSTSASQMSYMNTHAPNANFTQWSFSNTPANETPSAWSHPIYYAKTTDPSYTISESGVTGAIPCSTSGGTNSWGNHDAYPSSYCPTSAKIPNGAMHATGGSPGDKWIGVVQPINECGTTGWTWCEFDAWRNTDTNPLSGGGTLHVGDYALLNFDGDGCCSGATAAVEGLSAGLVRGDELRAGVINHALIISTTCTNGLWVAPAGGAALSCANASVNWPSPSSAPADGARLQLMMSDATINGLSIPNYQKVIYKALAHYGMVIVDTNASMSAGAGSLGTQTDLYYDAASSYTSMGGSTTSTGHTVMDWLLNPAAKDGATGYTDPATPPQILLPWTDFQVVSVCYSDGSC